MPNVLTKKYGPLPGWGWVLSAAVGVFLYYRYTNSAANAAANTPLAVGAAGAPDPSAIDPNTGLTYGQEESAALGGFGGGAGGSLGSTTGSTTDTGSFTGNAGTGGTPLDLTGGFADQLSGFGTAITDFAHLANQLGFVPAGSQAAQKAAADTKGKAKTKATKNKTKPGEIQSGSWKASVKPKKNPPKAKASSTHRAPAHPNENTHHQAASHTRPAPASTRVTVHKAPAKPPARKPVKRR